MTDSTLLFLHMTKTAGGSVKEAVSNSGLRILSHNSSDTSAISDLDPLSFDLIYGHFLFGLHRNFKQNCKYVTFLRHPITRTISHYYHLKNVDGSHVGDKIRNYSTIDEFFRVGSHWEFSNFMTRVISGCGPSMDMSDAELLDVALKNIENKFVFVGFQEFMDLSLLYLSDLLGKNIFISNEVNLGNWKFSNISDKTIRTIVELNGVDLILYRRLLDLFLKNCRRR